ncbi:hypothetical protein M3Y98_00565900 [Aphelenchoides besseyi]|nr:hypothetical protein M3Y98_00565900 [Aphelenchoides besseyi]KAI6193798.1 hypothetical protein M3Y96_01056900 [Aphelenchoides besseyi]
MASDNSRPIDQTARSAMNSTQSTEPQSDRRNQSEDNNDRVLEQLPESLRLRAIKPPKYPPGFKRVMPAKFRRYKPLISMEKITNDPNDLIFTDYYITLSDVSIVPVPTEVAFGNRITSLEENLVSESMTVLRHSPASNTMSLTEQTQYSECGMLGLNTNLSVSDTQSDRSTGVSSGPRFGNVINQQTGELPIDVDVRPGDVPVDLNVQRENNTTTDN